MDSKFSEEVQKALAQLLLAESEDTLRRALEQHSDVLLTGEGEKALDFIVKTASESGNYPAAAHAAGLLQIVQKSAEVGVDNALKDMRTQAQVSATIFQLLQARTTDELSDLLSKQSEMLLTEDVLDRLRVVADNEDDDMNRFVLRHRLGILERAKRIGIAGAVDWERHADLFRQVMNTKTPRDAERIVAEELETFVTENMGEVVQELLSEEHVDDGTLRKFHRIRAMIIQELKTDSSDRTCLIPKWLDTTEETRRLASAVSNVSSLDELRQALDETTESDPQIYAALADVLASLSKKETNPTAAQPPIPSSGQSYRSFLGRIMDGLDTKTEAGMEELIDDVIKTFGPSEEKKQTEYEHWLVTPAPWLADLELPPLYLEVARTLSADISSIAAEIRRVESILKDTARKTEPLLWSNLHRQLAFLNLVIPVEDRRASLMAAFHHCKAATSVLKKRSDPVAWANTHALYGELFLAFLAKSAYGAVERKLRSIESTAVGRIEDKMREFHAGQDSADQAAGRFELALQVHRQSENLEAWATSMLGLATALALRWRGDQKRNETESLAHFRSAIDAMEHESPEVEGLFQARFAFCSQYLPELPLDSAMDAFAKAADRWRSPAFESRRRGIIEHWALRAFRAGKWDESHQAIQVALAAPQQEGALYHSENPAHLSHASYLRDLAAYSLIQESRLDEALIYFEQSSTILETSSAPARVDDLLQSIPLGVTVVAPLVTEHGCAVFVLPGGLREINAANVVFIEELNDQVLSGLLVSRRSESGGTVKGWLHALADWRERRTDTDRLARMTAIWNEILDKIGGLLIIPVLKEIPENTVTVVFVLHRGLSVLPLHAASVAPNTSTPCLIDHYPVLYAASIGAIKTTSIPDVSSTVLTVRPHEGTRLDFAERECTEIGRCFSKHLPVSGREATREKVLSCIADYCYVHFACHGKADWDDVFGSSLSMSDGALTIRELRHHARVEGKRLLTLSACETGVNDFRYLPNANLGMDTALREAGVACVLSSKWPVSDAATFLLMKKFYEVHTKQGLEPSRALAEAQIWLRDLNDQAVESELGALPDTIGSKEGHRFSNPFYWAAFGMTGL